MVQPTCLVKSSFNEHVFMFLNFSSLYTKVSMVGWLRRVGHAEGRKKRKKQKQDSFGHGRAEEKRFG